MRPYRVIPYSLLPNPQSPSQKIYLVRNISYLRYRHPKIKPITIDGIKTMIKAIFVVGERARYCPPYLTKKDNPVDSNSIWSTKLIIWIFISGTELFFKYLRIFSVQDKKYTVNLQSITEKGFDEK